ncbi:MAG: DUF1501 domain-containing protein [Verrucomicrobiales bacterium]|nr:DUF1501 domain-containing protein [Verrucomicrobiales bacterium]
MITIPSGSNARFCDGRSRRNFLQAGALAAGGVSLADLLRAEAGASSGKQGSVVMVYLPGGPTQHETFDPKPDANAEIRGSFGPIPTSIPGTHFCELLPNLARSHKRFSVIRTLTGMVNRHESFHCYTGRPGGRPEDNEPAGGWPGFGSVVSQLLGPRNGIAPYVDAAPKMSYGPYNNRGTHIGSDKVSWPGFTGPKHVPFAISGKGKADLTLNGIDLPRLGDRRGLLQNLEQIGEAVEDAEIDEYQKQAFGILTSGKMAQAMDLTREPQAVRDRYGTGQPTDASFGGAPQDPQQFLLARRLVEAGVRCVTVAFGAWDWHANREGTIEKLSKKYLPVFDAALATFLEDLDERGLLETTTVIVWGEFGRTPKINPKGGRDHWPKTQSVLIAGGGIQGGRVIGETDSVGGEPVERPVHVQEVFATLYQNCGIDPKTEMVTDLSGRPHFLVDGNYGPVSELLS